MVRSRFAAQMELLNTELIVMGTLCENALEHVMQALQEDNDALNREIIILGKRTEEKEREVEDSGEQAIDYLMIAKYFEKIGDHAVNISQWVLFMITGAHEEDTVHDLLRGGRS